MEVSMQYLLEKSMPTDNLSTNIAEFFSIFSDYTRIKIISALSIMDMCVGELANLLGANQSTISHQLKLLKDAGIVNCVRDGKNINYAIINPLVNDVMLAGIDNLDFKAGVYNPLS